MLSLSSISTSGIKSALDLQSVSANNVANSNTDGFKKDIVHLSEGSKGGVEVNIKKSTTPGPTYLSQDGRLIEASNVDYAEEAVTQITAKHLLTANIAAFKAADEMQESILDIFV